MERPELKKHDISLSYGVSKDSAVHSYTPTISPEEENTIRQWVNDNYSLYSDTYKDAAYRDAQQAVLNKKADVEKKAILQKERKERAEKAAYQGNDKMLNQQKQLAAAENAISDAAELIRQGQEMNGVKVDKYLTDRETVNAFLDANTEMPFAEYVNKFLDAQAGKSGENTAIYDNKWLAAKLGLLGGVEGALINAGDKLRAGTKGFAQGLANLTQNTIGAGAEYLGSNLAAGLGEIGYGAAEMLGADVSEGTVWDKMKKAKGYDWKEAQRQASSEDLFKEGMLTEDEGAYNVGETLGELTTDIALTAPAEGLVGGYIASTKLPKRGKTGLQLINAAGGGAAFQGLDDLTKGELSSAIDYGMNAGYGAATAGLFNVASKLRKGAKAAKGGLGYSLFGPSGQTETAMFKTNPKEWDSITNINKSYAKNKNMARTPYTELTKKIEKGGEILYDERVQAGKKLEEVENELSYFKGKKGYTAEDVVADLEKEFGKLGGGPNAKLPKFTVEGNKLTIDPEGLETLNSITRTSGGQTIRLGDEILNTWDNLFTKLDKPLDATNTRKFIRRLQDILKDEGYNVSGGDTVRAMKNALNGVDDKGGIVNKFEDSLSTLSKNSLKNAKKNAEKAIKADEDFKAFIGNFRNGTTAGNAGVAEKAFGGKAAQEEVFKKIKSKYKIDLNNEILKWAYNMSLYDVKKAAELLEQFYPSKPGVMELILRKIFKGFRRSTADRMVKEGAKAGYKGYKPSKSILKSLKEDELGPKMPITSQQTLSSAEKLYEDSTD